MTFNKSILIHLFIVLCISFGFSQTADIIEGCVPLEVNFTAPANTTTFYWEFKDGASSIQQNPSNVFINPGTYIVEFREILGGPIIGTVTIAVYPTPTPTITTDITPIGCGVLDLTFTANANAPAGITITDYDWTFGDGFSDNGQVVSHQYTNAGYFDVGVEVLSSTPNCNVTLLVDSLVLLSRISGNMFISPSVSCDTPTNVFFFNNVTSSPSFITDYLWDFGDGTTSTNANPPTNTYTAIGTTPISLTVTDSIGCTRTFNRSLNINPFSLDTFVMPDTVCVNSIFGTRNLITSYNAVIWSFSGGPGVSGINTDTATAIYDSVGVYNVTLFINKNGCIKNYTRQITVIEPVLNFTINPDTICSRNFTITLDIDSSILDSVKWIFEDTVILSTEFQDIVTYTATFDTVTWEANDTLKIVGYTKYGCVVEEFYPFFYPPIAHPVPSTVLGLSPLTVNFFDESYSFLELTDWTLIYGDGVIESFTAYDDSVQHIYTSPGLYNSCLVVQNSAGCMDTTCVEILVGELDTVISSISGPSYLCVNEPFNINYSTPDTNQLIKIWADDLTVYECPASQGNISFEFNHAAGPQDIEVEVSSYGTVFLDTTISIYVHGAIADFSFTQYCDSLFKVDFTDASEEANQITYLFGDGSSSNLRNPTHYYAAEGTYEVTQIAFNDTSSCAADTFKRTIEINIPTAAFTYTQNCAGDVLDLDGSLSSGLEVGVCKKNYLWFSNNVPYRFNGPLNSIPVDTGIRELSLIVENSIGCMDTLSEIINVQAITTDIVILDPIVCIPEEVIFDANLISPNPITFQQWTFGDGNSSLLDSVMHTYTAIPINDTFTVIFEAVDVNNCSVSDTNVVTLFAPEFEILTNPSDTICLGDSIQFTASGSQFADLAWDFNNGLTATGSTFSVLYDTAGIYNVKLTYTDTGNVSCIDSVFKLIDVRKLPDLSILSSADQDSAFCFPLNIDLEAVDSNTTSGNFLWNVNGTNFFINPISLTFNRGINDVTVIRTTAVGCSDTATRIFNVIGPEADFIIDTNNICKGEEITFTIIDSLEVETYVWDFGDGITENDVSPVTHQYNFVPPNGQTKAKLSVFGFGMVCPFSIEKDIFLYEVFADFLRNNGDTAICYAPYLIENLSVGADNYEWNMGDGTILNDEEIGLYNFPSPGDYNVSLYIENNEFGCKDSITKLVTLFDLPSVTAIGDSICEGDTARVFITDPDATNLIYTWQPSGLLNLDTGVVNQGVFTESQTLQAFVVDSNNCKDSTSLEVLVVNPPNISGLDTIVVQGEIVVLPLTQQVGYQYTWNPETGLSCLDCNNPSVQVLELSTYELTYLDTLLGCFEGSALYLIDVYPETFIKLPNTFTPNGDGNNDIVYVEGWGLNELEFYRIYNRWGELVFETDDVKTGWNGSYKGVLQNDDVYQYKVKGFDFIGRELEAEGFIHLMH